MSPFKYIVTSNVAVTLKLKSKTERRQGSPEPVESELGEHFFTKEKVNENIVFVFIIFFISSSIKKFLFLNSVYITIIS